MTIEKGQPWGGPAPVPEPNLVAGSDAELAAMAAAAMAIGEHGLVRLTGGDLLATLGVEGVRAPDERHAYPVDLALAHLEPRAEGSTTDPLPFVAHLIVGPPHPGGLKAMIAPLTDVVGHLFGHGAGIGVSVMNAAWLGELRLGPRAHPNDGLLDITEGQVGYRERREAAKRARSGSHLPHPALRTTRTAAWHAEFDRPRSVRLDGVDRGRVTKLRVDLVPDAVTVVA